MGFDYSGINPFNQTSHYHPLCQIKDWNNQEQVEVCRLGEPGNPDFALLFLRPSGCVSFFFF